MMNALTAAPQFAPTPSSGESEPQSTTISSNAGIHLNGDVVIFSLAFVLALVTAGECQSITHLSSLRYGAVLWGWWGCVASIAWRIGRRVPLMLSFSYKAIAVHVFSASVLGVMHLLLLGSLGFTDAGWRAHATALSVWTSLFDINRFGIELLLYGFVFGITGIAQFQIRAQYDAMKSLELQKQLSAAHLQALQMQLEPHFLFNALNAITTLVELGRQKEATAMLFHLNAILKSTLQRTTPEKVPLSQELEMMENYLAIEQVRFADRLRVEIKVDPSALYGLVPCFLLQPIVENAIRHGIARCENEGLVEATARCDGRSLHLRVRDTGPGLNGVHQNGHGIGLRNTRERLTHFYQDGFAMRAHPIDTGGFEVAITIPYERN
jgi:signal transduction histidine kinase